PKSEPRKRPSKAASKSKNVSARYGKDPFWPFSGRAGLFPTRIKRFDPFPFENHSKRPCASHIQTEAALQ
ncbi:MAG: hypothetical protein IJ214_12065, partial [Clostridia bacterium]|nr:hypothetical protein [Clostridia bacterium]